MNKITAVRFKGLKIFDKMGRTGQTVKTMLRIIEEANQNEEELEMYCVREGMAKTIIPTSKLVGETFMIGTGPFLVKIEAANKFVILDEMEMTSEGALPSKKSVEQLKSVNKYTKKVSKAGRTATQGNLLDKKIETETRTIYDWYQFNNKSK